MKKLILILAIGLSLVLMAGGAFAVTDTKNLTVSFSPGSTASLTLGVTGIVFPDSNPDSVPSIPATQNAVSVTAKALTGSAATVTLTALAGGNLVSGADTIAISNITWTATGTGYVAGTMSTTPAQSAGSWTGSGDRSGTFSYFLANSWSYATGAYTATITYTLTAP